MDVERVVIVGGGAAGLQVAEGLRKRGFSGALTLIERDDHDGPYDRPPLSKQFLAGEWDRDRVRLRSGPELEGLAIEHRAGVGVTRLAPAERSLTLSDGSECRYDALVIATGASPVVPREWQVSDRVLSLRTLDDAELLSWYVREGRSLCVVGAGMIGSEISSTARALGATVTLVDAAPLPLRDVVGVECAQRLAEAHDAHGVQRMVGVVVESVAQQGDGVVVRLADGRDVEAEVLVVAVGVRPETGWLNGSGIEVDDGVLCDEGCQAAPGVYAVGDVARVRHVGWGEHVRIEHRMVGTEHARVVADRITGTDSVYEALPYYWSDQYGVRLQGCGVPAARADRVESGVVQDALVSLFVVGVETRGAVVLGGPRVFPRVMKAVRERVAPAQVWATLDVSTGPAV